MLDPGDNNDGNFFDVADGELDGKRHNAQGQDVDIGDGEPVYEALSDYYNNTAPVVRLTEIRVRGAAIGLTPIRMM